LLPYNLSFLKPVAAGLMALLITLLIEWWFPTGTNFIYIAVHTAVLVAIYAGLVLLLGLSTEDRLIIARLRRRAGNKWSKKHSSKQN
jgi:hypothetical protein